MVMIAVRTAFLLLMLRCANSAFAQVAPVSPYRPWHGVEERNIANDPKLFHESRFSVEPNRMYSLSELIDLAQTHHPDTRMAWEGARAQLAAWGLARSESYPTLAAIAFSQTSRDEVLSGTRFNRQTVQTYEATLDLNYTIFDFGARAGRIAAAKAQLLAANFAFNDTHRRLVYQVQQAYYRLLNASGQEDAARASLLNAQTVQQAAEDRLKYGLATLPDVLEARSSTAQAEYDLQAVLGEQEIARGDLATALGTSATVTVEVQPLGEIAIPESISDTVDDAIDRALQQRPDLLQRLAEVRSATANVKEVHAGYYPALKLNTAPTAQALYGSQQALPQARTGSLIGGLGFTLNWTIFDGGARKNRLDQAEANIRTAQAQVSATRDQIADQIWTAYSNLKTALRQRQSAVALLEAASQSYAAALESYNYGVRSLLDLTAAQKTLAQARSVDVLARTQLLTAVANLAFQTGDVIQSGARRP